MRETLRCGPIWTAFVISSRVLRRRVARCPSAEPCCPPVVWRAPTAASLIVPITRTGVFFYLLFYTSCCAACHGTAMNTATHDMLYSESSRLFLKTHASHHFSWYSTAFFRWIPLNACFWNQNVQNVLLFKTLLFGFCVRFEIFIQRRTKMKILSFGILVVDRRSILVNSNSCCSVNCDARNTSLNRPCFSKSRSSEETRAIDIKSEPKWIHGLMSILKMVARRKHLNIYVLNVQRGHNTSTNCFLKSTLTCVCEQHRNCANFKNQKSESSTYEARFKSLCTPSTAHQQ